MACGGARHWLDSAGYTDTTGQETIFDGIWRYRDYVVDSFNEDKPYDRFLVEQIAGDELVDWRSATKYTPEILSSLIATGYLRSTFDRTDADITNLPQERYDVLIDLVDKVSNGVLGCRSDARAVTRTSSIRFRSATTTA